MATQPDVAIRLSGGYDFNGLDRLIHLLTPILELTAPARIRLDLENLIFISPAALALLTASLKGALLKGFVAEGIVVWPAGPSLSEYLSRMGFLQALSGEEPLAARQQMELIMPCRAFDAHSAQIVAANLSTLVAERCPASEEARRSLSICLSELADNVVSHAQAAVAVAAASGWKLTKPIEAAIVDLGVGIRSSLRENPLHADIQEDGEAISAALQLNVTGTNEPKRGLGLWVISELLRANGGQLLVRSGDAAVYSGNKEEVRSSLVQFRGTVVAFRARVDRPLDVNTQVYSRLPPIFDDDDDT